ncbi:phage head spike fiber domain-containing protein [Microbacterium kyungheense]|uniref:Carbohydrate binding protein n=1 Tax=Microbacterium kyungheense TaxID=1263636 RepID=A0A543EU73_9MICO|nr:hypothetical protein [Microbacterium kyungheense]TQM25118.1 hypothetical protein FB391_2577 [Microbacterium kyungheense]
MTTRLLEPVAVATIDTTDVKVAGGKTRLDSSTVPYASATLEFPLLDDTLLDWLDGLRDGVRIPYEAGDEGDTPRLFDLSLRGREVDHTEKRVTLTLASDEALLIKYQQLTLDSGARAHETSLRAVCNYVLAKIGASLEAGADDADVTAYWAVTNMLPNPSFETNLTGWSTGFGATSFTRPAHGATPAGAGSVLRWVANASTSAIVAAPGPSSFPVTPGRSYVFSIYAYGGAARTASARLQWFASDGTVLIGEVAGAAQVLDVTGVFKRFTVTGVAPAGATTMQPILYIHATANGEAFIADCAMLYEGDEVIPYHDGATAPAGYTVAWSGTAHASPSTRTPVVERRPELFTIKPGTSLWDFLLPITSQAGMVLWCDELRHWHLAFPESRTIPTLVSVSESNTSLGVDSLSLDDEGAVVSGVILRYRWTENGAQQEAYDTAGDPDNAITIDIPKPYPGPGAASAVLARRQGSGRRQTVKTITQQAATPGMTAQISLPGAPDTIGRIQSVEFDHDTGFMDLDAAGLVDIIPGSVDALVGTVDSLVGTVDSL